MIGVPDPRWDERPLACVVRRARAPTSTRDELRDVPRRARREVAAARALGVHRRGAEDERRQVRQEGAARRGTPTASSSSRSCGEPRGAFAFDRAARHGRRPARRRPRGSSSSALAFPGTLVVACIVGADARRAPLVRRSTLLSGLVGWVVGVGGCRCSIAADKREPASEGFARNLVPVLARSARWRLSVWIEFLAAPGHAGARADRPRVGPASDPLAPSARAAGARATREITRIAVRNGLGPSLGLGRRTTLERQPARPTDPAAPPRARGVRRDVREARADALDALRPLSPPTPSGALAPPGPRAPAARGRRRGDARGGARRAASTRCSPSSTGTRSPRRRSARCTAPRCPTVRPVVVKVQRPGHRRVGRASTSSVLEELGQGGRDAHVVGRRVPGAGPGRRVQRRAPRGARLPHRGAQRDAIASNLPPDRGSRVPTCTRSSRTSRVLVMEWLDGASVRDVDWGRRAGLPTATKLADQLLRTFLEQMLVEGRVPRRPAPGQRDAARRRAARADRLRRDRAASTRSQQAALRDLMVGVSRRDADAVAAGGAAGRDAAPRRRRRRLRARTGALHGAAPRPRHAPDAAMFNDDAPPVLRLRHHAAGRAEHVLPGADRARGHPHDDRARLPAIDAAEAIAREWARTSISPDSVQEAVREELFRHAPMLRRLPRQLDRLLHDRAARRPAGPGQPLHRRPTTCTSSRGSSTVSCSPSPGPGRPPLGGPDRYRGRADLRRRHVAVPVLRVLRAVLRHRALDAGPRRGPPRRRELSPTGDRRTTAHGGSLVAVRRGVLIISASMGAGHDGAAYELQRRLEAPRPSTSGSSTTCR